MDKLQLLLETFEKNVGLEAFYLDSGDRDGLLQVLREQGDLIPVLVDGLESGEVSGEKAVDFRRRMLSVVDRRLVLENRVREQRLEISQELGKLRQASLRLKNWRKAWLNAEEPAPKTTSAYYA